MDKEWKDSLRERFSDFSVPEPEGLWEGIEQGLPGKKRRKVAPVWWISGAAAAAAAVALVLLPRNTGNEPTVQEGPQVLAESFSGQEKADSVTALPEEDAPVVLTAPVAVRPAVHRSLLADAAPVAETESVTEEPVPEEITVTESVIGPISGDAGKTETSIDRTDEKTMEGSEYWGDIDDPSSEERSGFSIGLFREGGQESGVVSQGYGMSNTGDFFTRSTSDRSDTPSGLMRMLSSNRASSFDARHGAPVRVGVTLSWQFLPWLGLASGLNWTQLNSELTESTVGTKAVTRQRLGYLGVPLRLEAGFSPLNRLRLYAGAGAMAETCLQASATTDSYFGDHLQGSETYRPDAGGLLWSVGASAGAEYRFAPNVGIYFAPGIEYHFDNGSKVQSAYTAKPLHYNLSLGLRFSFGQ